MSKISKSGIAPQQQIKSEHLIRIIDSLSGEIPNTEIEVSGSIKISGSNNDLGKPNLKIVGDSALSVSVTNNYGSGLMIFGGPTEFNTGGYNLWCRGVDGGHLLIVRGDGRVGFGPGSLSASSIVTMNSTTRGFRPPVMTELQRTNIISPIVGLHVYQSNGVEGMYVYKSTGWTFVY